MILLKKVTVVLSISNLILPFNLDDLTFSQESNFPYLRTEEIADNTIDAGMSLGEMLNFNEMMLYYANSKKHKLSD